MSFKRVGTPEPMQTLKFKCRQCGKEAAALTNGLCDTCNTQTENKELKEFGEQALKKGMERIEKEEKEAGVEPPKEKK